MAGEAADGAEVLVQIEKLHPDIVIMDINIPVMNGLKVIEISRATCPDMAFLIVSGYSPASAWKKQSSFS